MQSKMNSEKISNILWKLGIYSSKIDQPEQLVILKPVESKINQRHPDRNF
jgi:hypothetical protein